MPTAGRAIAVHHDSARARGWGKARQQSPPATGGLGGSLASMQAAVGVRRPLSQNIGSDRRSGSIPVRATLWERPWPRYRLCCPQASMQAAVAVRKPLPQNSGSDRRSGSIPVRATLWERPWPRYRLCCPQASMQAAVAVRKPLPQNSGSDRRWGAIPVGVTSVGAALAATRPLLSAGFDSGCYREQARSHEIGVSRAARARCAGRNRTTRCPAWRRDWERR
jgi:hypothetical protein